MTKQNVMLLGGEGFIGSALARKLRADNHTVTVVTRQNLAEVPTLLESQDTVVHLASCTTPSVSASEPSLEQNNIALTNWLIELLLQRPHVRLIYISSGGTVYGNPTLLPVTERAQLHPLSPYGIAKVAQEGICNALGTAGSPVVILRPSNAYGPGQELRKGFGLVRQMLECIRVGAPIDIWGDGESIRDYIYIEDLVNAIMCVMRSTQSIGTFNIGSGLGHSVNQIRMIIQKITKQRLTMNNHPMRASDVRAVVLDATAFSSAFEWTPQVNLEEGILATWESMNWNRS